MTDSLPTRPLGRTGRDVSSIGLGTWQLGADWGEVDERDALAVLDAAVSEGVTFLDTADVYGDGRSERVIGRFLREHPGLDVTVATKMGRRGPQEPGEFHLDAFRAWTDRSRRNLGVDTLDLVQLHCPPTAVLSDPAVYDALDTLVADGAVSAYGVSVETCDEALAAIAHPHVTSVQIIVNAFRLKPFDEVVPAAARADVAVVARVPLASGLLAARYSAGTTFADDDHRTFNRDGSAFDVGETFSGVDFDLGVRTAADLAEHAPEGLTPAQAALAWLARQDGVTTVIPGARDAAQARGNADAGRASVGPDYDAAVRALYDERLRDTVHPRW